MGSACSHGASLLPYRGEEVKGPELLRCRVILSAVPHAAKAEAVRPTMQDPGGLDLPATALRGHPDATPFLDGEFSRLPSAGGPAGT